MIITPKSCYNCKKYRPYHGPDRQGVATLRMYGLCCETPGGLPYPVYAPWGCCENYEAKEEAETNAP